MDTAQIHTVPQPYKERQRLRKLINNFVSSRALVPPLSMTELSDLSLQLFDNQIVNEKIKGWLMVEIHNAAWRSVVASVPYERRILVLPKCLSNSKKCEAEIDELGLLCHRCSRCSIPNLQDKADELGMMSLVAEGFTSVVELIKNRVVDAVIGVSCLDSLEKTFPLLISHAVPGLAIPLNVDGCKDTDVDYEYVYQLLEMKSDEEANLLDYDKLKTSVNDWFSKKNVTNVTGEKRNLSLVTGHWSLALDWLCSDGKRWRPYLLASVYLALSGEKNIPQEVQTAAVAVECFHKASLVHDDIEDNDAQRYGRQTVHAAHGSSVAINVGDMLLGEGYRLLTNCGKMELIKIAAAAHLALCNGQGMELEWSENPQPLTMDFVLEIFQNKTVPAFDVALSMGAIFAKGDAPLQAALHRYSQAMGVAYQLQDDLEDFDTNEPLALRPSAVLAALCEQQEADKNFTEALFKSSDWKTFLGHAENKNRLEKALERVQKMAEQYHTEALATLREVANVELKRLLFRLTQKILKK
ncbi:MAG: polyprenyl synthetase family protein [Prevotellaceae bacterium]|jgi:geranylgeranyl pyrophosphate synthase|nr:polyprenyl synthetase family protein [Prevotellaceae bacterium]